MVLACNHFLTKPDRTVTLNVPTVSKQWEVVFQKRTLLEESYFHDKIIQYFTKERRSHDSTNINKKYPRKRLKGKIKRSLESLVKSSACQYCFSEKTWKRPIGNINSLNFLISTVTWSSVIEEYGPTCASKHLKTGVRYYIEAKVPESWWCHKFYL